jgi:hypothetical protein
VAGPISLRPGRMALAIVNLLEAAAVSSKIIKLYTMILVAVPVYTWLLPAV